MESYPGLKQGHIVAMVDEDGLVVELEDGAHFRVYSGFQPVSARWQPEHMIRVKANPKNPEHPYKLINIHLNQEVEAYWLGNPGN